MNDLPSLRGKKVLLRPLVEADAPAVLAMLREPEVRRLTGTRGTFAPDEVRAHLRAVAERDDRVHFAICDPESGAFLGEAVLFDIDPPGGRAHFRIALAHPRLFGRGLGGQATRLLLGYAFEGLGLRRIELEVYGFNRRALRLYEGLGFRTTRVERGVLEQDGERFDAVLMALEADAFTPRGS